MSSGYLSEPQYGFMSLGRSGFQPFPNVFDVTTGVRDLWSWRVEVFQPDPNIIINRTGAPLDLGHSTWQTDEMTLHPGADGESAAIGFTVQRDCTLLILLFSQHKSVGFPPAELDLLIDDDIVASAAVGQRLHFSGRLAAGSRIQFSVSTPEGLIYHGKTTSLRYALFAIDPAVPADMWQRLDRQEASPADEDIAAALAKIDIAASDRPVFSSQGHRPRDNSLDLDPALRAHLEACLGEPIDVFVAKCLDRELVPPRRRTVTYFTPRSGSTAFAEIQSRTGRLGMPIEYCMGPIYRFFAAIMSLRGESGNLFDFIEKAACDSDGVFSMQIDLDRLDANSDLQTRLLGYDSHICFARKDLVSQAISHFKAVFGDSWSNYHIGKSRIEYSREHIIESVRGISDQLNAWERYFRDHDLNPLRLYYEDVLADQDAQILRLAAFIGSEIEPEKGPRLSNLAWQPIRNKDNAEFRKRLQTTGGEVLGYNIHDLDGRATAILAGLSPGDLPAEPFRNSVALEAETRASLVAMLTATNGETRPAAKEPAGPAKPPSIADFTVSWPVRT